MSKRYLAPPHLLIFFYFSIRANGYINYYIYSAGARVSELKDIYVFSYYSAATLVSAYQSV